jgi:1,6-anhydro-N-acetylmuramate kinase
MTPEPRFAPVLAIGMMSGTSLDGVDAALIETDGEVVRRLGRSVTLPYPEPFRERLRAVFGERGDVAGAARELTERHAEAVAAAGGCRGSTGHPSSLQQTSCSRPSSGLPGRRRSLSRG